MSTEVGRFTLSDDHGTLTGPKDFFDDCGGVDAVIAKALASTVFEVGLTESPNVETALLVAIQTEYAGWKGSRGYFAGRSS